SVAALERVASHPDLLLAFCAVLSEQVDVLPSNVGVEAAQLYEALARTPQSVGLFDEKQYFMGETALLAGRCFRQLGKRDEAERWLDRSEAAFRHTVKPGPSLPDFAYARLTLKYACHRHEDVLELLPSLLKSFQQFGMNREAAKCRFLEAMTCKELGKAESSASLLESLRTDPGTLEQPGLLGQVLI